MEVVVAVVTNICNMYVLVWGFLKPGGMREVLAFAIIMAHYFNDHTYICLLVYKSLLFFKGSTFVTRPKKLILDSDPEILEFWSQGKGHSGQRAFGV